MQQPFWVTLIVWIHVAAAVTTLLMGPLAMLTRKGGQSHRRWGKIFFWSMAVIFVTAIALLFNRFAFFLLVITILSFYSALTGYRVLYRKKGRTAVTLLDQISAIVTLLSGIGFMAYGGAALANLFAIELPMPFPYLGLAFGFMITNIARQDLKSFNHTPTDKNWWWYYHMDRMLSAYIATVTALAVQTASNVLPLNLNWIAWVAPAVVGVPLANYWIAHYRKRFTQGKEKTVG